MNKLISLLPMAALLLPLSGAETLEVVNHCVIAEAPTVIAGSVLARLDDGTMVACYESKVDSMPGNETRFVRSADGGKHWSSPYLITRGSDRHTSLVFGTNQLADGRIIGVALELWHNDTHGSANFGKRTSRVFVSEQNRDLHEFVKGAELPVPSNALCVPMLNGLRVLQNGDWLLPAYMYVTGNTPEENEKLPFTPGSGFFRSRDQGKSWDDFQLIFAEPHPEKHRYRFNEAVVFQKPDGTLIAFARHDSYGPKKLTSHAMWKARSTDNGKSWSTPVETGLFGNCPIGMRLRNGKYLLLIGDLKSESIPRTCVLYLSDDGENFRKLGPLYYPLPGGGRPFNTATGGTQTMIELPNGDVYVTFYSARPDNARGYTLYIAGNTIRIK